MALNPLISVVIPTYNRADLIVKTINSLQLQQYKNYEIIIVDDGSTDNTAEVVQPLLNDKTHYVLKENAERAAARNYGVSISKGEYINFFDSDDIALPNHLATAAAMIEEKGDIEWFHMAYSWADPQGNIFRETNHFSGQTLNHIMCNGNPLSCNGVIIRKDIAQKHKFNEDRALSASEDYELWCRLAARYPLHYTNTITSVVIDHEARSVRRINGDKLIRRLQLLVSYLQQDEEVRRYFGKDFDKIKMDANSYIALHLGEIPGYKLKSIFFLFKSFTNSMTVIKNKRFYATLKNILIKW